MIGMLPKVAVVLFVKDEFPDFCGWLAWYFAIGVDTIIVHDDHSVDGTWEAALAASRCLDVRPFRTDLAVQPFTARQRDAYLGSIKRFSDEFDWIGCLDADEYLYLRERIDLPSFLARFPQAGAIAFSWCIYGSNRHLLKPAAPTVEAFTRHSLPEFGHNRSVKSFVRPKRVIDRWRDPHTFEIDGAPYLDPRGNPVRWGGPGAIAHDPDWSVAKLMHFIPRSMEHFVERIRRRADLHGVTNEYWNVFDMNDVEDREPLAMLPATKPFLSMIDNEIMKAYVDRLIAGGPLGEDGAHIGQDSGAALAVSHVRTGFGTVLALDGSGRLVHLAADGLAGRGCTAMLAVCRADTPGTIILFAPQRTAPLAVTNDPHPSGVLAFKIEPAPQAAAIRLRNPRTRRYLTALPPQASGTGSTAGDRGEADAWETFELVPVETADDVLADLPLLPALVGDAPTAETIVALARAGAGPAICAAGVQLLSVEQRSRLNGRATHILPSWA